MFTDIVGFTPISRRLRADRARRLLNRHFALLGGRDRGDGGTLDKYIGDCVMAFWGAPEPQPDHRLRACARRAGDLPRPCTATTRAAGARG